MILENRIKSFAALGNLLQKMSEEERENLAYRCEGQNPFFTPKNINKALNAIIGFLDEEVLTDWLKEYKLTEEIKKVGVVMAGNIPAVGFHDALCVLSSGYELYYKPSSKDSVLINYLLNELVEIAPEFKNYIHQVERLNIDELDAVIATGSNNTSRYFEQYFGKIPNIIRKGRTSCAVLTGKESDEELEALVDDVFTYFGLGCRSVSKLFVPQEYDFSPFLKKTEGRLEMVKHSKYFNNYEYHKSILLVNRVEHLDSGTLLLKEEYSIASPMSVLHYETYKDETELEKRLNEEAESIQCVVGKRMIEFGKAQTPSLFDYADGIDTMSFLVGL